MGIENKYFNSSLTEVIRRKSCQKAVVVLSPKSSTLKLKIMLKLKIISPEKIIYDGEVKSVTVPGTLGSFEILNNHAPIISALTGGKVEYITENNSHSVNVEGGFVEVKKNEVSICVEMGEKR